jgi:hypothetical protein
MPPAAPAELDLAVHAEAAFPTNESHLETGTTVKRKYCETDWFWYRARVQVRNGCRVEMDGCCLLVLYTSSQQSDTATHTYISWKCKREFPQEVIRKFMSRTLADGTNCYLHLISDSVDVCAVTGNHWRGEWRLVKESPNCGGTVARANPKPQTRAAV